MIDQIQFTQFPFSPFDLAINFGIGIALSSIIGWHYQKRAKKKVLRSDLGFILPVISMTTLLIIAVVKSSLALSLGLVGALSIVRFRTPIKEPEELAYIFLSIAVGLCLGADQKEASLIGVFVILLVLSFNDMIRLKKDTPNPNLLLTLETHLDENSETTVSGITKLLKECCKDINVRQIDHTPNQLTISCLVRFDQLEDVDKLNDLFISEFPGSSFSILDDSSFPNE